MWGLSSDSLFHNKKWMFLISATTSPLTTSSALKTAGTFPETINTNSQWGMWWFISEEMHATQQTHPSLMSHGTTITFLSIEKLNGGGCVRACRVMKLEKSDEPGERVALAKGLHQSYSPGPCVTVGTIRLLMWSARWEVGQWSSKTSYPPLNRAHSCPFLTVWDWPQCQLQGRDTDTRTQSSGVKIK